MRKELEKTYDPSQIEDRLYANWCEKGYFTPQVKNGGKPIALGFSCWLMISLVSIAVQCALGIFATDL